MRVRELMETEVVTLDMSDTLDLADDVMRLGRIRHLPIVERGVLMGVISQRDLFRVSISSVLRFRRAAEKEWLAKIAVRDLLTWRDEEAGGHTPLFTIAPEASIAEAVSVMLNKRVGCLPVVQDQRLLGLLSETDCLRYLSRLLAIAADKDGLPELPKAT